MSEKSREKYYPQHADYYKMYPAYRPYVYWINEPMYESPYVNTDSHGLRLNYLPNGTLVNIKSLKDEYTVCDIIIGGSTVFGVDASSDKTTISCKLSGDNIPCINFGNRGAVAIQELLLFLQFKELLPKVRNLYLLSGVNECSLASMDGSLLYDQFGGLYGQDFNMTFPYMSNYANCYDDYSYDRLKLYNAIEKKYRYNKLIKFIIKTLLIKHHKSSGLKSNNADFRKSFPKKIINTIQNLDNTLNTWSMLAKAGNFNIFYFLQPCINWNSKKLTELEFNLYQNDVKVFPPMEKYANQDFYTEFKNDVEKICLNNAIPFFDCNEILTNNFDHVNVFTDVCHLTDEGNELIANYILKVANSNKFNNTQ